VAGSTDEIASFWIAGWSGQGTDFVYSIERTPAVHSDA